jgi:hypothetical protein
LGLLFGQAKTAPLQLVDQGQNRRSPIVAVPGPQVEHDLIDEPFPEPLLTRVIVADHEEHLLLGQWIPQQGLEEMDCTIGPMVLVAGHRHPNPEI